MATTNSAFVKHTNADLVGATVATAGVLQAVDAPTAVAMVAGGNATRLDRTVADLSTAGFAKNGAATVTLSGTTPVNIDLTNLATATTSNAGDTGFAHWSLILFKNTGAADVTIAQGASNPASLGFAGTTPTLTIPAGSTMVFNTSTTPIAVDGTHKIVTVTPTAGGSFAILVGGD
jgi:hypothetical protein